MLSSFKKSEERNKGDPAKIVKSPGAITVLFTLFFISGFTALLYQVAWQRMLGLFSGSDVRSVTVVVASYLLGLGLVKKNLLILARQKMLAYRR